jgi:hypothetical protein
MVFTASINVGLAAPDRILSANRISIQPASASLAGGEARLTTTGLQRQGGNYAGNYRLKVVPYFFKSESGTLSMIVSDELLRKLVRGSTVSFVGKAVTTGSGTTRAVRVKATPMGAGAARGSMTISIPTENGELVFATEYTLGGG